MDPSSFWRFTSLYLGILMTQLEIWFDEIIACKQEINLGIIGNLACHDVSRKKITTTDGLIGAVLQQLFLDDTACLCEACRYNIIL